MGSLALAVAGGIGGLGQGVANVAQQDYVKAREEAFIRLRAAEEAKRQQTGIEAQKALQASGQQFEAGQTEKKLEAASRAHGATLAQEREVAGAKNVSEEKRTETTGKYRLASAEVRAAAMKSGRGNVPIWELHNISVPPKVPLGPDGKPDPQASLLAKPTQRQVLFNKLTGDIYAPVGGRLYRWDSNKNEPVNPPASTNRAVDPGEIRDLLTDPMGVVHGGPNDGLPKAAVFERVHGYLPAEFTGALQRAQAAQNQGNSSVSLSLPAGLVHSIGGPNATSTKVNEFSPGQQAQEAQDTAEQAREDAEDAQDNASAQDPSAPSQADNDFSNIANQ